jgi:hypothetical protein
VLFRDLGNQYQKIWKLDEDTNGQADNTGDKTLSARFINTSILIMAYQRWQHQLWRQRVLFADLS